MPSHGSLTKAGKVRAATPNIPRMERKGLIPRRRNRRNYKRRVIYNELNYGKWGRRKRRRRR